MRIVPIVENASISKDYKTKHGLSLYIETDRHKVLFDLGENKLFLENARKMDINIEDVDTVIISHGHCDHGGGLKHFLKVNSRAKVYIKESAFNKHCTKVLGVPINIGLKKSLKNHPQIVFTDDLTLIDDELQIFSGVDEIVSHGDFNHNLFEKRDRGYSLDRFNHEQNLIITEGNSTVVIAGCAHKGIYNIVKKSTTLLKNDPKYVISGFHLHSPRSKGDDSIITIANLLNEFQSTYYTCHCTGTEAYRTLKACLGKKIHYLATGEEINL
ncbi:MAG: MBL fold metallo-hydrolase [Niameybacter sp.]